MATLDEHYWTDRYDANQTGWDLGQVSPPLAHFIDQIENKELRILIPGAGNAYEFDYLLSKGFSNVYVIDISKAPISALQKRHPQFRSQIIHGDFFTHEGSYDLIIEQTFFCALDPSLRSQYVQQMSHLLAAEGRLVGLLFNRVFDKAGPPFGGTEAEYRELFSSALALDVMEACRNSVSPRQGYELFFMAGKI